MHDGGEYMTAFLNGMPVCTSKAVYGTKLKNGNGGRDWTTIARMTDCPQSIPVKRGDKITIETGYDEIAHPL
jgi:hypothetical protein